MKKTLLEYGAKLDGEPKEDETIKIGCFRNPDGVMLSVVQYKKAKDYDKVMAEIGGVFQAKDSNQSEEILSPEKKEMINEVKNILKNLKI